MLESWGALKDHCRDFHGHKYPKKLSGLFCHYGFVVDMTGCLAQPGRCEVNMSASSLIPSVGVVWHNLVHKEPKIDYLDCEKNLVTYGSMAF